VILGCIQKFPDWFDNEINNNNNNNNNNKHSWEAIQRVMAAKLTRLTHKIAIQLHLAAESCTICSSRSRRPVRKLLNTPSYVITVIGISSLTTIKVILFYAGISALGKKAGIFELPSYIESHGRIVSTRAMYSGGPRVESWSVCVQTVVFIVLLINSNYILDISLNRSLPPTCTSFPIHHSEL
jgi:hypothetical protein